MSNFNHTNRRKAAYRKGFDAGLIVSPFPAVRALRNIAAMQDNEDADIDNILLIASTALKMQAEQATINIDYVARSIVRAACELDTTPDPESDDTITITVQDLEAIAHRHITASVERFELLAPEPTTPAAAPSLAVKALEWHGNFGKSPVGQTMCYRVLFNENGAGWGYPEKGGGYYAEQDSGFLMSGPHETHDLAKAAAQVDYEARIRSALTAQVQDVAGTVEAFDKDHPELYWHVAKGKITAGEPLYAAIITDLRGKELGHGESDVSAEDAFSIAVSAALSAPPAKQREAEKPAWRDQTIFDDAEGRNS